METVEFKPGIDGLPKLPWQLEVRAADGCLITSQGIEAAPLPTWLWVLGGRNVVQATDGPITGPYLPCPTVPPGHVELPAIPLAQPGAICAGVGLFMPMFRADLRRHSVYAVPQGGTRVDLRWAPGFTAVLKPEVDVFDPLGTEVIHAGRALGDVGVCPDPGGVARYVIAEIGAKRYWP